MGGTCGISLHADLSTDVILSLKTSIKPCFDKEKDTTVYLISKTLYQTRNLPRDLFERAQSILGTELLLDLNRIMGYYAPI